MSINDGNKWISIWTDIQEVSDECQLSKQTNVQSVNWRMVKSGKKTQKLIHTHLPNIINAIAPHSIMIVCIKSVHITAVKPPAKTRNEEITHACLICESQNIQPWQVMSPSDSILFSVDDQNWFTEGVKTTGQYIPALQCRLLLQYILVIIYIDAKNDTVQGVKERDRSVFETQKMWL